MRLAGGFATAFALGLAIGGAAFAVSAQSGAKASLHIDVPVVLKEAKVVFDMDHLSFEGETPTGLAYMRRMTALFAAQGTRWQVITIFHGPAGYMMPNDAAYNRVKKSTQGNPYRQIIEQLQKAGVQFEECGETAHLNGWVNTDFLPTVMVTTSAESRLVQLAQTGFVKLHP